MRLQQEKESEFDLTSGNLEDLEIRPGADGTFHFFFDRRRNRLVKRFLLRDGPRVDTLCDVKLIRRDEGYSPRLTFWKRDKSAGEPDEAGDETAASDDRVQQVKSRVDLDESHENFWKLVTFLSTYREVVVPAHTIRIATGDQAALVDAMQGQNKEVVLSAVATALSGELTDADVEMLRDRRKALDRFELLFHDEDFFQQELEAVQSGPEAVWQSFFEENTWIFGYGLTLVACESYHDDGLEEMTTGRNVFEGGGKRSDALMKTKGFVQMLLFAEIKRHDTPLLSNSPYRRPDVFQPSVELTGAVSQIQKTAHKAVKKLQDLHRQHRDTGEHDFDVSTVRPRQIVVAGQLDQLTDGAAINVEKLTSFELWRRGQLGVEVLTFDELFERARYIVEKQEE